MIEIHLVRRERSSTVHARTIPELAQQSDHPLLAAPDALDLEVPVPPVIPDIRRPLTWTFHRAPRIEQTIYLTLRVPVRLADGRDVSGGPVGGQRDTAASFRATRV
jgi:hypothetical protein